MGFEAIIMILQCRCDALTNSAMKPLMLGADSLQVGSNYPVINESMNEIIYEMDHFISAVPCMIHFIIQ